MRRIIKLPAPNHFGDCPKCRHTSGHLNIGRDYWFICKKHRVKWFVGSGIFPSWQHESERVWRQNEILLSYYMEVEPAREQVSEEEILACQQEQRKNSISPRTKLTAS